MIRLRFMMLVALAATLAFPLTAAADSVVEKLLRIAGLTAAPSQMRGPGDKVEPGVIWVAILDRQTVNALTAEGGYRSPVFSPADGSVFALKGDAVVRIPSDGGTTVAVRRLAGAVKLVGFDAQSADELLVLLESSSSPLGVLSLKSGKVAPLPYDATSDDQRRMLTRIRGQERVYGDASVYVRTESKRGLSRAIEWTDVYLRQGNLPPQNVSACDGVSCVQPALSPDGRRVVFVKTRG